MSQNIQLFLCGDVMIGRGIDQALPQSCDPILYESYVKDARHYVELAEHVNGTIKQPLDYVHIWGDALVEMKKADLRIINLETSITTNASYYNKGINYRIHPKNIPCLTHANIDCCVLANNHTLDFERKGLQETLQTLKNANIQYVGAGKDINEAKAACNLPVKGKGRVLLWSFGLMNSGIPQDWSAGLDTSGVNLITNFSMETIITIQKEILAIKQHNDIVIASIHWGDNWNYEIPLLHRELAHNLIDIAGVDIIHGHSSHHFLGIEVYNQKLILYGCGDFINDYEGISGHESYRSDLGLMYFVRCNPRNGNLVALHMVPTQIKKFQIVCPTKTDHNWLLLTLNRECKRFGTQVKLQDDNTLKLLWH